MSVRITLTVKDFDEAICVHEALKQAEAQGLIEFPYEYLATGPHEEG